MQAIQGVILDRDGVINYDSPNYILTPEQWQPIPGSLEAIARLTRAGILVAIASNQSAIGRGMLDETTFSSIHAKMMQSIAASGGEVVHVAYCFHAPGSACSCRKPEPGLILECLHAMGLAEHPEQALMIGDALRDVQAADRAGVHAWLVRTGYHDADAVLRQARMVQEDVRMWPDLASAVEALLGGDPCC